MNIPNFQQFEYSDVCNRHAHGASEPYYNKAEVDNFLRQQPGESHSCISAIIAHNDAAVVVGHQRGIRIHELEQEIIKLKAESALGIIQTAFETWAAREKLDLSRVRSSEYWYGVTRTAWSAWMAASGNMA